MLFSLYNNDESASRHKITADQKLLDRTQFSVHSERTSKRCDGRWVIVVDIESITFCFSNLQAVQW